MALPPKSTFKPIQAVLCKQAGVAFPMHSALGPLSQAEKGETNPQVFPAPTPMLLCSLRADSPSDFKDCLHELQVEPALLQTAAIHMHCCCSHPQIAVLSNIPGSHVGPALPHNTSPHTPNPEREKGQETLSSLGSSRSKSIYTQTLPASWRQPCSHIGG